MNERHEIPTRPTMPQPVTLVCVRCEKEWAHPHDCDAAYGDTVVRVINRDDSEAEPNEST
jgi:hypothetical protein